MKKLFYLFMVAMCATMFSACSDDDKDPLKEEEEGKEGVITMTTEETDIDLYVATFNEGDIITIDWGDGNVEEFKSIRIYGYWDGQWYEDDNGYTESEIHYVISNTDDYYDRYRISHEYPNSKSYTITIKGNIKSLYSMRNNLTSLDVSKNTALTELNCSINNLTSLDVSKNTKLTLLSCYDNNLTSLDVSKNTALKFLCCDDNNLTSLDVSKNTKLTLLYCNSNNFSASALNQIFRDLPQVTSGTIYMSGNPGTETCDKSIAENKGWKVYTTW